MKKSYRKSIENHPRLVQNWTKRLAYPKVPKCQKTIHPKNVYKFFYELKIEIFFGVGKVTAKKMNDYGIYYGKDLRKLDRQILIDRFGKTGSHYYKIVRSIQDSPVNPSRISKSV